MGAIRAREPVLLTSPASFGYTTRPGDRVIWEGMGELVLTPTTLYLVFQAGNLAGSRSLPISYAAIAEATTGSVSHWRNPPFGSPKQLDHMLLLRPLDGAIRSKGYNSGATRHQLVFNLIDPARTTSLAADQRMVENTDPAMARRAAGIIRTQQRQVDAFGRIGHGQAIWLATRVRPDDAQIARDLAAATKMPATPPGKPASAASHFAQSSLAVLGQAVPDRRFRPVEPRNIPWDLMEYGITPAETLSRNTGGIARLLVLEASSITFRTVPGSDRIEASYRLLADFFDLDPAKPGSHFWHTHRVTRPRREWIAGGTPLVEADLSQALGQVAAKVRSRL